MIEGFPIKDSWSKVTIADYMRIYELQNSKLNILEKQVKILAVLANVPDKNFNELPIAAIGKLFAPLQFLSTVPKAELKQVYEIGNRKYKLVKDAKDLTTGQMIDLLHYTKERDEESLISNLHLILTTVLLPCKQIRLYTGAKVKDPKTEKYLETSYEETALNFLENMNIEDALSISLFFCRVSTISSLAIKTYLEQETRQSLKSLLKSSNNPTILAELISRQSGSGLLPLTGLRMVTH